MLKLSKCIREPRERTEEEFYLVKNGGSQHSIYNFDSARVCTLKDLNSEIEHSKCSSGTIEYDGFDDRIGFYKWYLLGYRDNKPYGQLLWILSTSKDHPWLSQCTYGDFMM